MRAEFTISHDPSPAPVMADRLTATFGPNDQSALDESILFRAPMWRTIVLYSKQTPIFRLICFQATDSELQLHVESTEGNIFQAAQSVWTGAQAALKPGDVTLKQLQLVDETTNRELLQGRTGFGVELGRRETIVPITLALLVVIYATVGSFSFARPEVGKFWLGAISGIVGGLVALFFSVRDSRKGVLRWQ